VRVADWPSVADRAEALQKAALQLRKKWHMLFDVEMMASSIVLLTLKCESNASRSASADQEEQTAAAM
jgi:hypothetical protein